MPNRVTKSVAVDLDFNQNQIKNVLLHLLANGDTPDSPAEGQLWYDLDTHLIYFYNGSESLPVGSGSGELVPATSEILGGVKIGTNVNVTNDGTISINDASVNEKGIIRIATNNEVNAGIATDLSINPAQLKAALASVLVYKGTWTINSVFTTTYPSNMLPAKKGDMYIVTGTGPATVDGVEWNPRDYLIFNQNVAVGTTITSAMVDKIGNGETGAKITFIDWS